MSGIMVMSCAPQQKKLVYPETAKVDTVDVYFGTQVPDPYRWLENDTSAATTAWVEAQNKVTDEYLSQIPFRENLLIDDTSRLRENQCPDQETWEVLFQ